jgi:signal transduction histidine kinase
MLSGQVDGVVVSGLVEAAICAAVALGLFWRGARLRRNLFWGAGGPALSVGAACAVFSFPRLVSAHIWASLPTLFLLGGAVACLASVGTSVRQDFRRVVLQDLRGRRRWEAAEEHLASARRRYAGERHDINSLLSALDGTMMVLASQRKSLPSSEVDRLFGAVREEIQALRSVLAAESTARRLYDLSHLLRTIVAVRQAGTGRVNIEVEAGMVALGRPERLVAILDNLLGNAAKYAPSSEVSVSARRDDGAVEIIVADRGPGLFDDEMGRAFERGWRGRFALSEADGREMGVVGGKGLGLYQCRELALAEGGSICLRATDPASPPGRQGLTAVVRLPLQHNR